QHEGKITGLAALGIPTSVDVFENKIMSYNRELISFEENYKHMQYDEGNDSSINMNILEFEDLKRLRNAVYKVVNDLLKHSSPANIAASVQVYTEKMLTNWIEDTLNLNGIHNFNIVLSGGLFANVKVNYAIKKLVKP